MADQINELRGIIINLTKENQTLKKNTEQQSIQTVVDHYNRGKDDDWKRADELQSGTEQTVAFAMMWDDDESLFEAIGDARKAISQEEDTITRTIIESLRSKYKTLMSVLDVAKAEKKVEKAFSEAKTRKWEVTFFTQKQII
jgi:hypothetical protein